jgi:subtilase family serine protease
MMALALIPAALTMAAALPLTSAAAAASPPPRQAVPGVHPSWANASADTGPVAATATLDARVYLAGPDPAGLSGYASAVADPGSALYRHYLTPAQFSQRFGPTRAQARAVTGWLTGAGLSVTSVNSHYIAVRGNVRQMETAFGARLHSYRTVSGTERASQSQVTVPSAVASAVLTVTGLSTTSARMTSGAVVRLAGAAARPGRSGTHLATAMAAQPVPVNMGACSAYWGQRSAVTLPAAYGHTLSYAICGYVPAQLRAAYQVTGSGLTGRGVAVAVVDEGASPTIASDVSTYARRHGGQALRPGQLRQYLPSDIAQSCVRLAGQPAAYSEESLDVEAVHAMAPDAGIAYVGADCSGSVTDMLDAETRIVDGHLADIVSDSWHFGTEAQVTPDTVTGFHQIFEQGAIEGIGFYFSSGDYGDWSPFTPGHTAAVQYPGSDPWVTSVGGTSLAIGRNRRYLWETGWGTSTASLAAGGKSWNGLPGSFAVGAGGGPSSLFAQPFYQRGIVPASLSMPASATAPARVMPDIAAVADPDTGMLIGLTTPLTQGGPQTYVEGVAGGTSLATPLIAGIQADAQQAQHGVPIGFANPAIYARYGTPAYRDVTDQPLGPGVTIAAADASRDLVTGAITYAAVTFARDTSLHAVPGYDDVTGVGSPARRYLDSYRSP